MNYIKLLDKARDLNNEYEFKEAINILESIKLLAKDDIKWYYRYAYALLYTNQFKKAIELLEEGIKKVDASYPFSYLILGQLYYWKGERLNAFKVVEKGWKLSKISHPDSVVEFEQVLIDMYFKRPFVNKQDWRYSVLGNEFDDYDEKADAFYKIKEDPMMDKKIKAYFLNYKGEKISANLFIAATINNDQKERIQLMINVKLIINRLGMVLHTEGSHINMKLYQNIPNYKNELLTIINENIPLPRGSYLEIINKDGSIEHIMLGDYDVLSLGINLEDLADANRMDSLISSIEWAFDVKGKFIEYFFYYKTEYKLFIRFLGSSYEEMEEIIKEVLGSYPMFHNVLIIHETDSISNKYYN